MVTNATELETQNLRKLSQAETEAEIARLTSGVNVEGLDLRRNYGKLFAVIAGTDGRVLTEQGPFGGANPAVVIGETTWQFADAVHAKMRLVPGAVKFMAWLWNVDENRYMPARTKFVNGNQVGSEGAIDQFVRRHAGKAPVSSLPGVAEVEFLMNECKAQAQAARKATPKGTFNPDAAVRIARTFAHAMRVMGVKREVVFAAMNDTYPELFAQVPGAAATSVTKK